MFMCMGMSSRTLFNLQLVLPNHSGHCAVHLRFCLAVGAMLGSGVEAVGVGLVRVAASSVMLVHYYR